MMAKEMKTLNGYEIVDAEARRMISDNIEDLKSEVAQDIIAQLQGLPVFGVVDADNTITVTSQLSDGTYTLKYEHVDGATTEIGTIIVGTGTGAGSGGEAPEPEEVIVKFGYEDNTRWSVGDGTKKTDGADGYTAIDLIPITRPSGKKVTIELSGITWVDTQCTAVLPYIGDTYQSGAPIYFDGETHDYSTVTGLKVLCHDATHVTVEWSAIDYTGFKFVGKGSGANATITYKIE